MQNYHEFNRDEKERYWNNHIELYRSGELTQKEYCNSNQLNKNTFAYWIGKQKKQDLDEDNKLIQVSETVTPSPDFLELIIHDSIKIRVSSLIDLSLLKDVLSVLGVY